MELDKNEKNKSNQIVKNALWMSLGTLSSRMMGLVRDTLVMSLFPRFVTDAWTVAFRLPNILRRLLGEGSLSVSFVPIFIDTLHEDNNQSTAKNFFNSLYTLLILVVGLITACGIIFSANILELILDAKYIANTQQFALTVAMSKIMFGFIFLMSQYAVFMAALNALGHFWWPAMAPIFFNLMMIISSLIPDSWGHFPGEALAWGVVIGGIFQAGVLLIPLRRLGFWPRLSSQLWTKPVKDVLIRMVPGLFGLGLLQISLIINQRFATSLGEGPVSYIYLADRLLELPLSLISVSLGTALLPTLSSLHTKGRKDEFLRTAESYFGLNFYVVMAAATGLYFLSYPIVELLFKRGFFSESDAVMTSEVVKVWALILIPSSGIKILAPIYFSVKNTWMPPIASLFSLVLHYLMAPILMHRWGLTGLNWSSLISNSVNFLILFIFMGPYVGQFNFSKLLKSTIKVLSICGLMAISLQMYDFLKDHLYHHWNFVSQLICLMSMIIVGGGVYIAASKILKLAEYEQTFGRIIKRALGQLK